MKRQQIVGLVLFCAMLASCTQGNVINIDSVASPKGTEVFKADLDSIAQHYEFPQWYTDAKFGIFIHWGVYSVPAYGNEWYPRNMYQEGSNEWKHHREVYGDHTEFGYKDFIPMFKAERFDADEWAQLFRKTGARYVVPVAEHHDGFSMYDSDLNPWNAVKMGPKKDIIGLLKAATEKEGLAFGVSSHRAENAWFYNGGMKFPSDVQDSTISLYGFRYDNEAYTEESSREWLTRTYEIVNKYQPKLIFFDWTVNNPTIKPYFTRFLAYYYNNSLDWGEGVVVNTKQGYPTNVMVWDVERGKSDKMMLFPWQTDTSIGTKSWGYIADEVYKTPGQIVDDLVDIVSKNGNMLLNICPCSDGTIPQAQQDIMLAIGEWLNVNGEAIYGSTCWKHFGEGDTETTKGSFSDNKEVAYTSQDLRFTTKGDIMYVTMLEWGEGSIVVKSLTPDVIGDSQIKCIEMLGSSEKIEWKSTDEGLQLSLPAEKPCDFAQVFKIFFDKMVGENTESEASNEVLKHGN